MTKTEIESNLKSLPGWRCSKDGKAIEAEFVLKDFTACVTWAGKIAEIAEQMDHHPDLHLTNYKKLRIVCSTHSAGGVTESDFELAKKIGRPDRPST